MDIDESQFLETIKAEPDIVENRLVFADWLEERGDARGELIRIEETCRTLAPYSDHYWEHKQRRDELRRNCPKSFLTKMGYGEVYSPVFTNVPHDWRSRWRLIREFTERWFGVLMPDVGRAGDDARALEAQLGRKLPPSIVEWMAFTEDVTAPARQRAMEMLRDGREIADFPEHESVSLNLQAEGDVHWAVKYVAFDEPDPPVDVYFLEYDRDDNRFVREESLARLSVTDFAISYLLSYAHGKTGFGVDVEDCSKFIDEVRLQVASCSRFGGRWLIEDAGILATLEDGAGAFGISNSIEVRIHETATRVPACLQRLESSAHMSFERRD